MSEDSKPFVEKARIQNFGCVRDVTLELTRLHALIGPNDSGKSTVLSAIHTVCERGRGRTPVDSRAATALVILTSALSEVIWQSDPSKFDANPRQQGLQYGRDKLFEPVRGASLVRWDPDIIRQPRALFPEGSPLEIGERGEGLPAIYEAVLSRDREAFGAIEASVRRHFPTVKSLWLPTTDNRMKELGVILADGAKVNARTMSEGLLYWLAFAAIPHISSRAMLLVEEPENGLHPSRIAEVMKTLRAISEHTQVIIATHSPLVINELQPDEVTIITRDDKAGTRATRMDRTKHFKQREKVYALGELWLSFADGDAETELVPNDESTQ